MIELEGLPRLVPVCAHCRCPGAKWNEKAFAHLCDQCESNALLMASLVVDVEPTEG